MARISADEKRAQDHEDDFKNPREGDKGAITSA
jgi:hypothetical protein